jgi:hypothetical protein
MRVVLDIDAVDQPQIIDVHRNLGIEISLRLAITPS